MPSYYDIYFVFQIFSYLKFPRSNKYFLPRYLTTEYNIFMYIQYNVLLNAGYVVLDTIKVIYIHLLNAVKVWRVG